MNTENLSTLKIHKLTQAQYERELAAGRIDENALYLTPDEEIDLSPYATVEQVNDKADKEHHHGIGDVIMPDGSYLGQALEDLSGNLDSTASELETHMKDMDMHIDQWDRQDWNYAYEHAQNTGIHVTQQEKDNWDDKAASDHTHDEVYAKREHVHGYAPANHTHDLELLGAYSKAEIDYMSTSIYNNIAKKADVDHTHDDAYATVEQVNLKQNSLTWLTKEDIDAMFAGTYSESDVVTLVDFTIDGTTYQITKEGMTWYEWCNSDYNTDRYWCNNPSGYVYTATTDRVVAEDVDNGTQIGTEEPVFGNAYIRADYAYYTLYMR